MQNIGFNHLSQNIYIPNKSNKIVNENCNQNLLPSYSYPVYTQIPYGINKTNYVKLGVQKLSSGDFLHTYMLTTGQKVGIIKSKVASPVIFNQVNTGANDEPDGKEGISHLIEHSLYHGSKKYPFNISEYINSLGGETNAHTNGYETCYYIKLADDSKLNEALDANADMLFNPSFSDLKKEKPIVVSELKESEINESKNLYMNIYKKLLSISKPTIKNHVTGSEVSVNSITQNDMFEYHKAHYVPSNITTVVMCDKEPDELIGTIASKLYDASRDKICPPAPKRIYKPIDTIERFDLISKDSTQKKVEIGFYVLLPDKEDKIKLSALCELINMRTGNGIYYSIEKLYGDTHALDFDFEESDKIESEYESYEYLKNAINEIALNPPSEYELQVIKNNLNSNIDEDFEDVNFLIHDACNSISKKTGIIDYHKIINNLTLDDIVGMTRCIDTNKCAIAVLHPSTTTKEEMDQKYNEYLKYTSATVLSQQCSNVDIRNAVVTHDLKPYVNKKVYSTVLPDNTNLSMVDINDDNCQIYWNLFNINTNKYNPAIKYVLANMYSNLNDEDIYQKKKNGITTKMVCDYSDGAALNASCNSEYIEQAIMFMRKKLSIELGEKTFKEAKEKALSDIRNMKESASAKKAIDKIGISNLQNPQELEKLLEQVTLNDVRQYYNEIVNNSYSSVVVCAPFDKKPYLFNKVASSMNIPNHKFKKMDNDAFEKINKKINDKSVYVAKNETIQPTFESVSEFLVNSNVEDNIKFQLLANILNKRILKDLREGQGIAYTPYAYYISYGDIGRIGISTTSDCRNDDDVKKIFNSFELQIEKLKNLQVSVQELEEAKNGLKLAISNFSHDKTIMQIKMADAMQTPMGLGIYSNNIDIINSITPDDIQKTAQYAFLSKPDYLIDAPQRLIDKHIEYFKSLGKVKN